MFSGPRLPNLLGNRQLVVLVDEKSASCSEMLALGLKGRPNIRLVGHRTFGKGVLQDTHSIQPGITLYLTVGRFYSRNGVCPQGAGVYPDTLTDVGGGRQINTAGDLFKTAHQGTAA